MQEDKGSCRMTDHPNINNYALTLLKKKGFKLLIQPHDTEDDSGFTWWAKKGGRNFDASDPLRLLAMVNIWESYGDDWYTNPKMGIEKVWDQLADRAFPNGPEDFENMSEEEFQSMVSDYREFFELHMFPAIELTASISRKEMYKVVESYFLKSRYEDEA
ncbi:MAG: hypothetical protein K0S33_2854 [Bacteroidetes bacterium]|jgi:hypothetical protein|nr:hypothetical protein [Bacteroidota bacterium]